MSQLRESASNSRQRSRRLRYFDRCASTFVLATLFCACSYEPLTDAEKAGFDAAGADPGLSDDTGATSDSGSDDTTATSAVGGSAGSGGQSASVSDASSASGGGSSGGSGSGGASTTGTTNGDGGTGSSGGTGGTTASGGTTGSGGATTSAGGTGGATGTGGTGGASTTTSTSSSGGVTGTGGSTSSGSGGGSASATFRYVRLVAVSSQNGNPFTAIAELQILDASGQPLDNASWTASADSEETVNETAPASQAIDGDTDTFWHTEWGTYDAPLPHYLQIDLGTEEEVTGFIYTPRQDGIQNGHILGWEFYLSNSPTNPGSAVDSGSFSSGSMPKTVNLP